MQRDKAPTDAFTMLAYWNNKFKTFAQKSVEKPPTDAFAMLDYWKRYLLYCPETKFLGLKPLFRK